MSRKSKKANEKLIVSEQLLWLYKQRNATNLFKLIREPYDVYDKRKQFYNSKVTMMDDNLYEQYHQESIQQEKFDILLCDEGFISFHYSYNDDIINKACLIYAPPIDDEQGIEIAKSRYLRIDYAPEQHIEFTHTQMHAHFGALANNVRIPVEHLLFPKDFLYIVLTHYYCNNKYYIKENDFVASLIDHDTMRRNTLVKDEEGRFKILLGCNKLI